MTRPCTCQAPKRRRPWYLRWFTIVPALLVVGFVAIGVFAPAQAVKGPEITKSVSLCDVSATVTAAVQ